MVYGKRYARKRYVRRYRPRTLSNRNVYGNRSARAQATQIAALRRRINKVYRACKPETKIVHDGDILDYDFNNSATSKTWVAWTPPVITVGADDNQRVGNKVYRSDKWKFTATYSNNASSSSGLHNNETSFGWIRVICGCWKEPKAQYALPTPDSIVHDYGTTASAYNVNMVQPLANGVTAEHRIFSDKLYKVNLQNPSVVITAKTPFYSSVYDQQGYHIHSWLLILTGDLDWDSTFTENIEAHGIRKTVFTDA